MRRYFFVLVNDINDLNKIPGCLHIFNRNDGNGQELLFDGATLATAGTDYPEKVALVRVVPGTKYLQICPLSNDETVGEGLLNTIKENAGKIGLSVFENAKELSVAQPTMAESCLYPQRAVLDRDGKATGVTEKVTGSKLKLFSCLSGDDPEKCADPVAAKAEEALKGVGLAGEEIIK